MKKPAAQGGVNQVEWSPAEVGARQRSDSPKASDESSHGKRDRERVFDEWDEITLPEPFGPGTN